MNGSGSSSRLFPKQRERNQLINNWIIFHLVRLNQPFQKNDTQDWKWLFSQMHFIFLNNLQIIFSLQPPQEPKSDLLFIGDVLWGNLTLFLFSQLTHPNNLRTSCVKPAGAQNLAILGLQHAVKMNFAKCL